MTRCCHFGSGHWSAFIFRQYYCLWPNKKLFALQNVMLFLVDLWYTFHKKHALTVVQLSMTKSALKIILLQTILGNIEGEAQVQSASRCGKDLQGLIGCPPLTLQPHQTPCSPSKYSEEETVLHLWLCSILCSSNALWTWDFCPIAMESYAEILCIYCLLLY